MALLRNYIWLSNYEAIKPFATPKRKSVVQRDIQIKQFQTSGQGKHSKVSHSLLYSQN